MSRKRIKQYLMLLTVVGLIAVAANGSGTFATFNAEVTNSGNTFATGTLFLHDTPNGGTTCTSESDATNFLSGCSALFTLSRNGFFDSSGGSTTGTKYADLVLTNAGSLNAATLAVYEKNACDDSSAPTIATLDAAVTTSTALSGGIVVDNLAQKLVPGTVIKVGSDTFHVANTVSAGATETIQVTETGNWPSAHSAGAAVTISTSFTGGTGANGLCGNVKISIAEDTTPGATTWSNSDTIACVWPSSSATFDATTGCSSSTALYPQITQTAGNLNEGLNAGQTRLFRIFISGGSGLGNGDQNRQALFDLTWHAE